MLSHNILGVCWRVRGACQTRAATRKTIIDSSQKNGITSVLPPSALFGISAETDSTLDWLMMATRPTAHFATETPAGAEFTVPSATGAPMVIKLFSLATHNAPGAYGHLGGQ